MEQKIDAISGSDKSFRDPVMLLEDFRNVINENGRVDFDDYGTQREPAAIKYQVDQIRQLYSEIISHPKITDGDKEEIGTRMEKAEDYLRGLEESGR
ncbi:MAG TPA: hypothetical protein VJK01_01115 [Candidatus Paceibacterota bacterium]